MSGGMRGDKTSEKGGQNDEMGVKSVVFENKKVVLGTGFSFLLLLWY